MAAAIWAKRKDRLRIAYGTVLSPRRCLHLWVSQRREIYNFWRITSRRVSATSKTFAEGMGFAPTVVIVEIPTTVFETVGFDYSPSPPLAFYQFERRVSSMEALRLLLG